MPEDAVDDVGASGRTFWSGTISFGLVSVPVNLLPAYKSSRVGLRMVSPKGIPLNRRYFSISDDEPLDYEDIVRGYEVEKDQFVVVEDEELERLAPERTRDIDVRLFVQKAELDPIYFERAYYLVPAGESTKAYRLLARVVEDTKRAGIATFVMRGKEYLVAILAENGILYAETLRFADEVRTPEEIGLPEPTKPSNLQVKRFEKEIEKLAKPDIARTELEDKSGEKLAELARRKKKAGKDVYHFDEDEDEDEGDESREVLDLVALLQRSLQGGAGSEKTARKNGGAADLESSSRSELYEKAKKLDIPGRSGMSKEQLIKAIRRA